MSTAYHPQSDGQIEIVNKSLEQYLRAFVRNRPHRWADWLSLAEYWFNTNFHTSIKLTPFEALYGYPLSRLQDYIPGTSRVAAVDSLLTQRQQILATIKANLVAAQERMKFFADKHRTERSFQVGDWVFLRLQPYKQKSLASKGKWKLSPRFYGPFQVLQRVGEVAYRLNLPSDSKINPVFHVSCLKLKLGQQISPLPTLPPSDEIGQIISEPLVVLQTRTKTLRSRSITKVLTQWLGTALEDAT